jgi:hypothetical protein
MEKDRQPRITGRIAELLERQYGIRAGDRRW